MYSIMTNLYTLEIIITANRRKIKYKFEKKISNKAEWCEKKHAKIWCSAAGDASTYTQEHDGGAWQLCVENQHTAEAFADRRRG